MRLAALFVFTTGCGVTLVNARINPEPRTMIGRDPATVEVYTGGPPPRSRVDVSVTWADLVGPSHEFPNPFGDMLRLLRKDAGAHGCDALIVQYISAQAMVATCAMYIDSAPSPMTARPPVAPAAAPPPLVPHE